MIVVSHQTDKIQVIEVGDSSSKWQEKTMKLLIQNVKGVVNIIFFILFRSETFTDP